MRYVVIDPEGATRARFRRLREVREWAAALKERDPELLEEMVLMTYDASGAEVANQWLSDFVPDMPDMVVMPAELSAAVLTEVSAVSAVSAEWSGRGGSMNPAFPHPHTPASGTRAPVPEEMAAS